MIFALGFAIVVAVGASLNRPMEVAVAKPKMKTESAAKPLVRSDPGVDPWVEKAIPPPKTPAVPEPKAAPKPTPPSEPTVHTRPVSVPKPVKRLDPPPSDPRPQQRNEASPKEEQTDPANHASHYHLPPGAIMSLTIPSIGLENAPVLNSDSKGALDRGVVHLPDTSLPWSDTPERNVYLAGHRLGWPGTGSHHIFYRLNELTGGERITLRGKEGKRYEYRVLESFTVGPHDSWVTGRVRGRDLLTLQTCTPIPTFQKRLIVRAERS